MGLETGIAWTHSTWNPWRGCQKVSPGCTNCYAETLSKRNHALLGQWGPPASGGTRVIASPAMWREPLKWNAAVAAKNAQQHRVAAVQHRVFCSSLADVFEDLRELDLPRAWLWALIKATPHLTWLLLTKRPGNVMGMVPSRWLAPRGEDWPRNVWMGTTVEDQKRADERIPLLLQIPAPVRFLSVEPQLGPGNLDMLAWRRCSYCGHTGGCLCACPGNSAFWHRRGIEWVIQGGESGPHARPFDLAWAYSLRDQCAAAGVPFFFKQAGAVPYDSRESDRGADEPHPDGPGADLSCRLNMAHRSGADPDEWPEDLRIQQVPEVRHA